jgi:hypothetical protein
LVVERCLLMATDPGDLVLDPTCGSGTTAVVAEQWGRRWITLLRLVYHGLPVAMERKVALSDLQLFVSFLGHAERPQLAP